jgi:hypothetical protein
VALSHVSPLSHVLSYFSVMILSLLYLVIFRHPYLTHMKSNLEIFSTMNSALHILYIHRLDFYLKKKNLTFKL